MFVAVGGGVWMLSKRVVTLRSIWVTRARSISIDASRSTNLVLSVPRRSSTAHILSWVAVTFPSADSIVANRLLWMDILDGWDESDEEDDEEDDEEEEPPRRDCRYSMVRSSCSMRLLC